MISFDLIQFYLKSNYIYKSETKRIFSGLLRIAINQRLQIKMLHSQSQQTQNSLDIEQKFDRVLISTPLQQKYYNNITFKNAQQNVMKQLQKLLKSSFYTHFQIYLGAQNETNRSYIQQKYKRKEQILKLQIQQTKKSIFQLSRTNDEQEFDNAMQSYIKSMNVIEERSQDVDHVDFIPWIYVQANKKRPFYGHLMQQFNRKGAGMLNVKVGYRSPFAKLDCLQFKFQTPITNLRRKYFNFDLQWHNSHDKYGNIFTKLSHANQSLFRDIDQKSHAFNVGIEKPESNLRIEWQNKTRNPTIHQRFDQYVLRNYHLPSFKSSLKLTKVWQNTIQLNDVNMGQYLQTKGELTLPFVSKSQFAKFQVNYRKFYDTINMKKYFDNQLMRKLLYGSSIQTNLSWNIMKPFIRTYLSDVSDNMQIRGFDQPRVPVPTFSNCKLSAKFNIHNYPIIGQARITPFLYAQAGCSLLDMTKEKKQVSNKPASLYGLGSVGLGISYYVNTFAQIELVYTLASYQNLKRRQPTNFQVRIGVFD